MDKTQLAKIIADHLDTLVVDGMVGASVMEDEVGVVAVDTEDGLYFVQITDA